MIRIRDLLFGSAIFVAGLNCYGNPESAPINCVLQNPLSCPSVNFMPPELWKAVSQFLRSEEGRYFPNERDLPSQAGYGLGGPPDDRKDLGGGMFLFAACPPHDCGGQAVAVVLDKRGVVKGFGFSSFHCGADSPCNFDHRYLDFYVRRDSNAVDVIAALSDWGIHSVPHVHDAKVNEGISERTITHYLK